MSSGGVGPTVTAIVDPYLATGFAPLLLTFIGGKCQINCHFCRWNSFGSRTHACRGSLYLTNIIVNIGCETSGHYLTKQRFTYIDIKIDAALEAMLGFKQVPECFLIPTFTWCKRSTGRNDDGR